MSVKIRALRMGRKKRPEYRIVVMDSRKSRDSRYLENVGTYRPLVQGESAEHQISRESVMKWLDKGAEVSLMVRKLLSVDGLLKDFSESKVKKSSKKKVRKSRYHSLKEKVEFKKEKLKKDEEYEKKRKIALKAKEAKEKEEKAKVEAKEAKEAKETQEAKDAQAEKEVKEVKEAKEPETVVESKTELDTQDSQKAEAK